MNARVVTLTLRKASQVRSNLDELCMSARAIIAWSKRYDLGRSIGLFESLHFCAVKKRRRHKLSKVNGTK